mmetsp:Transcript_38516/g.38925  ORF Transcript_38516/g.38925 Transcript_38516/m.38925 type:complete len:166 (-) Transcript_38516:55-552(-)
MLENIVDSIKKRISYFLLNVTKDSLDHKPRLESSGLTDLDKAWIIVHDDDLWRELKERLRKSKSVTNGAVAASIHKCLQEDTFIALNETHAATHNNNIRIRNTPRKKTGNRVIDENILPPLIDKKILANKKSAQKLLSDIKKPLKQKSNHQCSNSSDVPHPQKII